VVFQVLQSGVPGCSHPSEPQGPPICHLLDSDHPSYSTSWITCSASGHTQFNFLLTGHFACRVKEMHVSPSFSFRITLQASELRKALAQSNLNVLRTEEMKNPCQILGTGVRGNFPRGAKHLAHSLIPSADFFLYMGSCSNIARSPGSTSRLSGSRAKPTCIFSKFLSLLSPDEFCPTTLSSEGLPDKSHLETFHHRHLPPMRTHNPCLPVH
jgi:hypothetical protein